MNIQKVVHKKEKSQIVAEVLADLPAWFGIPESTQEYVEQAQEQTLLAAYDEDKVIGFVTLSYTSEDCAEIACLGVKEKWHRKGIGQHLLVELEKEIKQTVSYLQVKTVNEGVYEIYDRTNAFYRAQGFKKLEVFPTLWDEANPCLIWVKSLSI